jgi:hypothetical protein
VSTATVTWVAPTARVDGSPLAAADIASYAVFDDASPGAPIGSVPGSAVSFTTGALTVGTHNFTVTVTDSTGHTSAPSAPAATVTVPATLANPMPPSNVTATLNP